MTNNILKYVSALFVLLTVTSANAEDLNSGTEFIRQCAVMVKYLDGDTEVSGFDATSCLSFVDGFVYGYATSYVTFGAEPNDQGICFSAGHTNAQHVRIIYKYMQDHPEKLHLDKGILVNDALHEAFPCSSNK